MKKPYIPFLVFLVLLLLVTPFPSDFATSVVPGWHTAIIPIYFIWELMVTIILLLATRGYWLLFKRTGKVNWTLFTIHFILTVPTPIYLKSSILLDKELTKQNGWIEVIEFCIKMIPGAWFSFVAGQVLFFFYYISAIKTKPIGT